MSSPPKPILAIEEHYSDQMLREIGSLFLTAASAECVLSLHVMRLMNYPEPISANSGVPVWGMDTKVKLEKIAALTVLIFGDERAAPTIKVCHKIRRAFNRRNELAHYSNGQGPRPDTIELRTLRVNANGELQREKIVGVEQVREFALVLHGRVRQLDIILTGLTGMKLSDHFGLDLP